ncbi:hypothetical protein ccbrp13_62240 [Ktedonobacteria bacterium brp13]|nr:hypothetical protein ccbrp13_62240 [Ktedonobacteria bacterium brp13]
MQDIAAAADCSLGLTYRYFASKEDLVLELYRWLAVQLEELVLLLPAASIADRFHHLMRALLEVMAPHRRIRSRAPEFLARMGRRSAAAPEQAISS